MNRAALNRANVNRAAANRAALNTPQGFLSALATLVALDTVSPMRAEALDRCEAPLAAMGCLRHRDGVFVAGDLAAPIWLYSHLDTKPPVPRERWLTDPLRLTEIDGRLVGLGVSDAKFQLLTAISALDEERHCLIVDTCEETDGTRDAADLIQEWQPDTLLVCDGGRTEDHDVFNGTAGQVDGHLFLDTGHQRCHAARSSTDALGLLGALCSEVRDLPARFTLTGLESEHTQRSLSLQRIAVRFDLRFAAHAGTAVTAFLDRHPHSLRHAVLHPLWGREILALDAQTCSGPAPFSTRLGGSHWIPPRHCVVVAGAHPDNGNHQPNEFVHGEQLAAYRSRLNAVLRHVTCSSGESVGHRA